MMRKIAAVLMAVLVLRPYEAHASIFGEENGPLMMLVTQGIVQLENAAQVIDGVQKGVAEAQKYTRLIQEAAATYKQAESMVGSIMRDPMSGLSMAFPDFTGMRTAAMGLASPQWSQSLSYLAGASSRTIGNAAATAKGITDTYQISVKTAADEAAVITATTATQTAGAVSEQSRKTVETLEQLRSLCTDPDSCAAATNAINALGVKEQAATNAQLAEITRLQTATLLEQKRQDVLEAAVKERDHKQLVESIGKLEYQSEKASVPMAGEQ